MLCWRIFFFFFFNDTATTEIYTLSLHDALPISYGDDASRQIEWRRESQACAGLSAQKLDEIRPGRFEVEAECPAQEVVRIEPAEDQVGICHRRLRASAAVTDGSRRRAGAFRTHAQCA